MGGYVGGGKKKWNTRVKQAGKINVLCTNNQTDPRYSWESSLADMEKS